MDDDQSKYPRMWHQTSLVCMAEVPFSHARVRRTGALRPGPPLAQRSIVGSIMGVVAPDLPGDRLRIAAAYESKPAYGWYGAPAPTPERVVTVLLECSETPDLGSSVTACETSLRGREGAGMSEPRRGVGRSRRTLGPVAAALVVSSGLVVLGAVGAAALRTQAWRPRAVEP